MGYMRFSFPVKPTVNSVLTLVSGVIMNAIGFMAILMVLPGFAVTNQNRCVIFALVLGLFNIIFASVIQQLGFPAIHFIVLLGIDTLLVKFGPEMMDSYEVKDWVTAAVAAMIVVVINSIVVDLAFGEQIISLDDQLYVV